MNKMKIAAAVVFLLSLLVPSSLAAQQLASYPWAVTNILICCEIIPASQSMNVEGEIVYNKTCDFDEMLSFDYATDSLKFHDENGKELPFHIDSNDIVLDSKIPLGSHTIHFEYSINFPATYSNPFHLFINETYTNLEERWAWYPQFPHILGTSAGVAFSSWFQAEITVTAPEGYTMVASGKMTGEKHAHGKTTRYFHTTNPVKGLGIYGGKYQSFVGQFKGIDFRILVSKDLNFTDAESWKDYIRKSLDFYIDRYGFFPFQNLYLIHQPFKMEGGGWGGPHGCFFIGGVNCFASGPLDIQFCNFVAHEMFHQYLGSMIESTNKKNGTLVSEGMTEYASLICADSFSPKPLLAQVIPAYVATLKKIKYEEDIEIMNVTSKHPHYLDYSYRKIPLFLLELRNLIGDARIKKIERAFVNKYKFKELIGFPELLAEIKSETSGEEAVEELCKAWLEQKGVPPLSMPVVSTVDGRQETHRSISLEAREKSRRISFIQDIERSETLERKIFH